MIKMHVQNLTRNTQETCIPLCQHFQYIQMYSPTHHLSFLPRPVKIERQELINCNKKVILRDQTPTRL